LGRALTAFGLFCLVSSSIYLLNDIQDYEQDRLHPEKCSRPLAAEKLSVGLVLGVTILFLVAAIAGGLGLSGPLTLVLIAYWVINFFYSMRLKHQVILDVFAIAVGFVLRVVGGGVAIGVEVSDWLLICTLLIALFLGFTKRRHELILLGRGAEGHRQVLKEYSSNFLDMMISIVTASTVMSYALYTVSEETVQKFHTRNLLVTVPFVLYGIFRYLYLVYKKNEGGDPTQSLLTDRPTILNLFLWVLAVGFVLYHY
jgi:4-hydroxybenzoate polyprenyltransferase